MDLGLGFFFAQPRNGLRFYSPVLMPEIPKPQVQEGREAAGDLSRAYQETWGLFAVCRPESSGIRQRPSQLQS